MQINIGFCTHFSISIRSPSDVNFGVTRPEKNATLLKSEDTIPKQK